MFWDLFSEWFLICLKCVNQYSYMSARLHSRGFHSDSGGVTWRHEALQEVRHHEALQEIWALWRVTELWRHEALQKVWHHEALQEVWRHEALQEICELWRVPELWRHEPSQGLDVTRRWGRFDLTNRYLRYDVTKRHRRNGRYWVTNC